MNNKIANICAVVQATTPPIVFLTGKTNFRNNLANRTPYKERVSNKPWHYKNIKAYLQAVYECRIQEGLEADDLMAIEQTQRPNDTIICTRDKDLFSVGGWVYSWELGNQPQFGPEQVHQPGHIRLSEDRKKLRGTGLLFFLSQCLTGDAVDTIPGIDKCGPVKAFSILEGTKTYEEGFERVRGAYNASYGENGDTYLLSSGRLLWMTRESKDGKALLWNFPNTEYQEWIDVNTGQIERVV